jgi:peptide/nickel transport system permease protein
MIPTMIGITFLAFAVMRLAPGDPASMKFGADQSTGAMDSQSGGQENLIAKFRRENLLDQPMWRQYLHFVGPFDMSERGHTLFGGTGEKPWAGLMVGDLKNELLNSNNSIREELGKRLQVTIPLALISLFLSYLIAIPLGIHSVLRKGRADDAVATFVVFLLFSIPSLVAGLFLQLAFGRTGLDWFPVIGLHDSNADSFTALERWWDLIMHGVLPVVCLTYGAFAYLSRQMRAGIIDVIRADYIRTARAKGLSERVVVLKHALRNALIPVITLFASALPLLIGGSVIIEIIFELPGMGRYAYEGLLQRDYNIVMATTTLAAFMTLIGILLADLTYALVDPRISYD